MTSEATRLRRLSWRQRRREPAELFHNKANNDGRHLTSLVRRGTFTVDDPNCAEKEPGNQCPLDEWMPINNLNRLKSKRYSWSGNANARGKYGESLLHVLLVNHSNEHLILFVLMVHLWPELLADLFESQKFKGLNCLHLAIAYDNKRLLRHLINLANKYLLPVLGYNLIEQQVLGSLFRPPPLASSSSLVNVETTINNSLAETTKLNPANTSSSSIQLIENTNNTKSTKLPSLYNNYTNKCRVSPPKTDYDKFDEAKKNGNKTTRSFWCDQLDHWPTANGRAHLILFDRLMARLHHVQSQPDQLPIYLGHTPLAWTVSFGSREMYELLVELAEADQNSRDIQGDTCLHHIVSNDLRGWTRFLVKMGANLETKNHLGLTPFLFACHLGRLNLFNEFLELSAVEFWSYSSIRCCGYSLANLDSIITSKQTTTKTRHQQKSAISVILESKESNDQQKSALLSSAVIKKLLEEKWRIFARRLFYKHSFISLVHLILMTLAISLRPRRVNQTESAHSTGDNWISWQDYLRDSLPWPSSSSAMGHQTQQELTLVSIIRLPYLHVMDN